MNDFVGIPSITNDPTKQAEKSTPTTKFLWGMTSKSMVDGLAYRHYEISCEQAYQYWCYAIHVEYQVYPYCSGIGATVSWSPVTDPDELIGGVNRGMFPMALIIAPASLRRGLWAERDPQTS